MDRTFAQRLSDLRNETGVTQKDAAAAIGVSQALLSHYERGIRECGLDFVARASDYYDVSCDYLLGKSSFRSWQSEANLLLRDIPEDRDFTVQTVTRVATLLREKMKKEDNATSERILKFYTLGLYRMILAWVNAGYMPNSWLGENRLGGSTLYSKYLSAVSDWLLDIEKNPNELPQEETPLYVKTLVEEINNYVGSQLSEIIPDIDQ